MTGVVLAGGEGTRLNPMTEAYNKHTAVVYDRPMIYYPLDTLKKMGCDSVVIVSGPKGIGDLAKVLKDGSDIRMDITYKVQPEEAGGTAQALAQAEGHVDGVFPVLCGDVYLDPAPEPAGTPTLYWNEFDTATQHSVWNPETNEVEEKPIRDIGKKAIIAYCFDERIFDVIRTLKPTERGEIELVDIYNWYLQNGAQVKEHDGFFGDMGTPDGLLRVAKHHQEKLAYMNSREYLRSDEAYRNSLEYRRAKAAEGSGIGLL